MGLSRKLNPYKVLRKGDLNEFFNLYDLLELDLDNIYTDDKDVRKHFDIIGQCADGAAHYKDCSWCLIEEDGTTAYNALKQLENTAISLHNQRKEIRRMFLFVKEIKFSKRFSRKGIVLYDNNTKKPYKMINGIKCCVYVVLYNTKKQTLLKELAKLEKTSKSSVNSRNKTVGDEIGNLS